MKKYQSIIFKESFPEKLYRACSVKEIISLLKYKQVIAKNKFISLSKTKEIFYNSDFSDSQILEAGVIYNTSNLLKYNKLIEVNYNFNWLENHLDIRNYIFDYIDDFNSNDYKNTIQKLKNEEQEILISNKLKINKNCINEIIDFNLSKKDKELIINLKNKFDLLIYLNF